MKNGIEQIQAGSYTIDVIVQGFPGKSETHGYLGWSTVALVRGHGHVVLVDCGSLGMRRILIQRLAELGVAPRDVTDLLLTHAHHDHAINWTLFSNARIALGAIELDWALKQPWGETSVAELYINELRTWATLHTLGDGEEVLPLITALSVPGHTPGSLAYIINGTDYDVIFVGDSAKNRGELVSGAVDMTCDLMLSADSIRRIWDFWCRKPGTVVLPGHDLPMTQINGVTRYVGRREATMIATFGESTANMTAFRLTPDDASGHRK
ncbi:MAG: MBL fold metallo-hydrolase [Candidatus Micrarchaeaceae archaeon]